MGVEATEVGNARLKRSIDWNEPCMCVSAGNYWRLIVPLTPLLGLMIFRLGAALAALLVTLYRTAHRRCVKAEFEECLRRLVNKNDNSSPPALPNQYAFVHPNLPRPRPGAPPCGGR
jgi:hypothetical protein